MLDKYSKKRMIKFLILLSIGALCLILSPAAYADDDQTMADLDKRMQAVDSFLIEKTADASDVLVQEGSESIVGIDNISLMDPTSNQLPPLISNADDYDSDSEMGKLVTEVNDNASTINTLQNKTAENALAVKRAVSKLRNSSSITLAASKLQSASEELRLIGEKQIILEANYNQMQLYKERILQLQNTSKKKVYAITLKRFVAVQEQRIAVLQETNFSLVRLLANLE